MFRFFAALCFLTALYAQQPGRGGAAQAPARIPTIEERTAGMQKLDGYFPLYWDERTGNLWLEIPRFDTACFCTPRDSPPDSARTISGSIADRRAAARSSPSSASDRGS